MNAVAVSPLTRIVAVAVTLALAAAIGWAAGSAINERSGVTNAGYPEGWQPGVAAPRNQAKASFSQSALEAVRVTRGEAELAPAPKSFSTQNYADLHPQHRQEAQDSRNAAAESDHGIRHPATEKARQNFTDPKIR